MKRKHTPPYSPQVREQVVRRVIDKKESQQKVAADMKLSPVTVGNWVKKYREEQGLNDSGREYRETEPSIVTIKDAKALKEKIKRLEMERDIFFDMVVRLRGD